MSVEVLRIDSCRLKEQVQVSNAQCVNRRTVEQFSTTFISKNQVILDISAKFAVDLFLNHI
jgi:hypothetical protein